MQFSRTGSVPICRSAFLVLMLSACVSLPEPNGQTDLQSELAGDLSLNASPETVVTEHKRIIPADRQESYDQWHYAPAVLVGNRLYMSGVIGEGADPKAQFTTAFERVRQVLDEAGFEMSDIVEMTSFHLDVAEHMEEFMAVKDEYIKAPYPAWTAVGASELVFPGGLVEIRVIAEK